VNKIINSTLLAVLLLASSALNATSAGETASKCLKVLFKKENGNMDKEKLFFAGITAISTFGIAAMNSADPGESLAQSLNFKALDADDYDFVYEVAEELCEKLKIKMPKIVVSPNPAPLATVFGGPSCIMVSEGLLIQNDNKNLQSMVAKEIVKIKMMKNAKLQIASTSIFYGLNMLRIAKFGNNLSTTKEKSLYWLGAIASNVAISKCSSMIQNRMMKSTELEAEALIAQINQEA
jgi:Zn-dependent protease with chaperone function